MRRVAICFSFSTCCFLNTWAAVFDGSNQYFLQRSPLATSLAEVVFCQIALMLLLLAAWDWGVRHRKARSLFWNLCWNAACIWPSGIAWVTLLRVLPFDATDALATRWVTLMIVGIAGALGFAMVSRPLNAGRALRKALLYASPALACSVVTGLVTQVTSRNEAYDDGPCVSRVSPPKVAIRVVWIVFDELSDAIAFRNRPSGLALSNFDQLRSTGFEATAADAPAQFTIQSVPSLITGDRITSAVPRGPRTLILGTADSTGERDWRSTANVFDRARELGMNAAIAGWYHPYGRVLNRSVIESAWMAAPMIPGLEDQSGERSLLTRVRHRMALPFAWIPLAGRVAASGARAYYTEETRQRTKELMAKVHEFVADHRVQLVFLHLPMPHPPAVDETDSGYRAGLKAADEALGGIRGAISKAGLVESSILIVTSDHGWRPGAWQRGILWTSADEQLLPTVAGVRVESVPFLIHFPDQIGQLSYRTPFNTVVTADLVLDILRRQVRSPSDVAAWIDSRRSVSADQSGK